MLKVKLGKGTVAIITFTVWALAGVALERFIGAWFLPIGCVVAAILLGAVFGHGIGVATNVLFFLITVPYAIAKTWHLGTGASVGLFAAALVVVLGLLAICVIPAISPVVSSIMRTRLHRMAAKVGTRPARADETVRASLRSIVTYQKDPFRFPVVNLPARELPLTFIIDRELSDLWLSPVHLPVPGEPVTYVHWPEGLPDNLADRRVKHTPLTDHVTATSGAEPVARRLLTPQLERLMRDGAVQRVHIGDAGVIVAFVEDAKPETFLAYADTAYATVMAATAAVGGHDPAPAT